MQPKNCLQPCALAYSKARRRQRVPTVGLAGMACSLTSWQQGLEAGAVLSALKPEVPGPSPAQPSHLQPHTPFPPAATHTFALDTKTSRRQNTQLSLQLWRPLPWAITSSAADHSIHGDQLSPNHPARVAFLCQPSKRMNPGISQGKRFSKMT